MGVGNGNNRQTQSLFTYPSRVAVGAKVANEILRSKSEPPKIEFKRVAFQVVLPMRLIEGPIEKISTLQSNPPIFMELNGALIPVKLESL